MENVLLGLVYVAARVAEGNPAADLAEFPLGDLCRVEHVIRRGPFRGLIASTGELVREDPEPVFCEPTPLEEDYW